MLCALKEKYRPDTRLRWGLIALAVSLLVLECFSLEVFRALPYAHWYAIGASVLSVLSLAFAVHAAFDSEKALALSFLAERIVSSRKDAWCIRMPDGEILLANEAGRRFWGGREPIDFLLEHLAAEEEDARADFERLAAAAVAGVKEERVLPLCHLEDSLMPLLSEWYRIVVTPLPEKDTRFARLFAHEGEAKRYEGALLWEVENVSAQKNMAEITAHEYREVTDFVDFLPAGLFAVDSGGRFIFVSRQLADWLGYDAAELKGAFLASVLDTAALPDMDGAWEGHLSFRSAAGEVFTAYVSLNSYDDSGETCVRAVVLKGVQSRTDQTKSRQGSFSLLSSAFFEKAPVGMAFLGADSCISEVNPAFARMVARRGAELSGMALSDLIVHDERAHLERSTVKILGAAQSSVRMDVHIDTDHLPKERQESAKGTVCSLFIVPLSHPLLKGGEKIDGAIVYLSDMTEHRSLHEQFAQAQKMQAMGQLAGGVAHDFNNLLTAMLGFTDLLLQRHGEGDPDFLDITQIRDNALRAAKLVGQLLAFSRNQALKPRLMDVGDALSDVAGMLRPTLGESLKLELKHGKDVGRIRMDKNKFEQIFMNLGVNASDAMPSGGRLTIRTARSRFEDMPANAADQEDPRTGDCVLIEVEDTGCGIPDAIIDRIFEPFFSSKETTTKSGTGLGLATVYGIVRQSDGFVRVKSRVGEGTTFSFYFPHFDADEKKATAPSTIDTNRKYRARKMKGRAEPKVGQLLLVLEEDGKKAAPLPADLTGAEKVLLVEDEDSVRAFAARALKNKGYTVVEAESAENALDLIVAHPDVSLLLSDMVMPGMDGATLAGKLRHDRPELRVILMSGYSEDVARDNLADHPDYAFLPKPFTLKNLAAKVKEVLNNQ